MTPLGPLPLNTGRESPESLVVSSGPVTLDIRPLSAYQQTLIATVLSLRSRGWSDCQIANHFNLAGTMTPRGYRFSPQSVFSMRTKYLKSVESFGGTLLAQFKRAE